MRNRTQLPWKLTHDQQHPLKPFVVHYEHFRTEFQKLIHLALMDDAEKWFTCGQTLSFKGKTISFGGDPLEDHSIEEVIFDS